MEIGVASSVSGSPSPRRVQALIARIARAIRESKVEGLRSQVEVSILFCGDRRMRTLNRRYRRKDRPTDVLAFPAEADGLLGDIVISLPYASRQAKRLGEPASREIDRLLLHGLLHLLGYDHETDEGEMDALEASLRRRLNLAEAA
jgi:probable rRNA maturation factor